MKELLGQIFGKPESRGVALIGFGTHMRHVLLPALRQLEIPVAGVLTRHPEQIRPQAQVLGIPRVFDQFDELKSCGGLQAAIVCTHADSHPEWIARLMPLNLPVFVEKPVAASSARLRELINAIGVGGGPVMVGMQKRFVPAYQRVKKLLDQRELGEFVHLHYRFLTGPLAPGQDFLLEIGVHALDLVCHFLGRCQPAGMTHKTVNQRRHYSLLYHNQHGDSAGVEIGELGDWFEVNERLELTGAGHRVTVDNLIDFTWERPQGQPNVTQRPNFTVPVLETSSLHLQGYTGELRQFFECLAQKKAPAPQLNDCLLPLELAELTRNESA